jgi:hypothetical protein
MYENNGLRHTSCPPLNDGWSVSALTTWSWDRFGVTDREGTDEALPSCCSVGGYVDVGIDQRRGYMEHTSCPLPDDAYSVNDLS